MAEDIENESIRISELPETTQVDKSNDCLVISKTSDIYSTGSKSYKITPQNLLDGVGVDYTAGDNITISDDNVISATIPTASSSNLGGVKVGSGLSIDSAGVLSATGGGGGASSFSDLDDVSINEHTLANGQVPVYNSATQKWENMNQSGGGSGHIILDDAGTSLTQRDDLQFKGAYSEDDSTNEKTIVNVVREMTRNEFDLLSADEKTGLINITDEIGDGLKYVKETLYSNIDESNWTAQSSGDTLTLTDNILDYDEVYLESAFWEGNNSTGKKLTHFVTSMVDHATIQIAYEKYGSATYDGMFDVCPVLLNFGQLYTFGLSIQVPTTTSLKIQSKYVGGWNSNYWGITRIIGIKYLSDSEHTYSEDEQIVGTWVDGKTLYEKTISTNSSSVNLTSLGINTLVKIDGVIQHTNGKVTPISYESATSDWAVPVYDIASKILTLAGYGTSQGGTWVLTIRYTKSST